MKINLAGYNIDSTVIEELKKLAPDRADITPETLSASYARISRDPRSIDELRKAARQEVEKTRKSNQTIIFKMGHHSVAEHAVFNFDVIGISRLAMEAIEHFRLCSYTEKSQRYITLGDDYVIPDEIKASKYADEYASVIKLQNKYYHKTYEVLKEHVFKKHADLASDEKNNNLLEGWAKEDARYITSLATQGQLGLTINARNLELMVRRFASSPYSEVRQIGEQVYKLAKEVAPSIILFTAKNDYDSRTYEDIKGIKAIKGVKNIKNLEEVQLADYTKNGDDVIVAALLHTTSNAPFADCKKAVSKMSLTEKKEIIKTACKYMEFYDANLREFEHVNLTYDLIISASCYAQLKRHRTSTQTMQDYDPKLGLTIPQAIIDAKMHKEFKDIASKSESLFYKMQPSLKGAAQYILTNAHRRRVLLTVNAREFYHISRLREDAHAQWDIQDVSAKMSALAKKKLPLTFMLIGGKDKYPEIYKEVFGSLPKLLPPK
jgi:flavin-dependent thymidylate synthase